MGMSISRERAKTFSNAGEGTVLKSGTALAKQRSAGTALAEASRTTATSSALEVNVASGMTANIQIASLVYTNLDRRQGAAGMTVPQGLNQLMGAERKHLELLAELVNPSSGVLDAIRIQLLQLARIAEANLKSYIRMADACIESFSRMTEACSPRIADRHAPVRIHAVHRLATQNVFCPGRSRAALLDKQPLSPRSETLTHIDSTAWLTESLKDQGGLRFLERLSRSVRSEEISSDDRDGINFLLAVRKLKKHGLSKSERNRLYLRVVEFLRQHIGVPLPAGGFQQLASGLLVPHPHDKPPTPDLAPEIFTTQQLAKMLPATTDTLKRHAQKACENGPLPQEMQDFPGLFVVERGDPRGGQGNGWKFQRSSSPRTASLGTSGKSSDCRRIA